MRQYLGKTVNIIIDRPLGSTHPNHPNLVYLVNYGYIPDIIGGDGEEQDIYLLGVDEPVKEYTAKVIGIVHRKNDIEDKLVAAPDGVIFDQAQIAEMVDFQEKFFDSHYESLYPKSCGAIVYRRGSEGIRYLCLKQTSGVYSTPKGHMEAHESEPETARREILEEIGLTLDIDTTFRYETEYKLKYGKLKTLVLFLAECAGELNIDPGEITEHCWLPYEQAREVLPYWYTDAIEKADSVLRLSIQTS
ncbi:MAG: NUDIX domain-containing protein [Clostridia bacterium]|nr:NUDIX domain-containing protein [Clostridia bacterium]